MSSDGLITIGITGYKEGDLLMRAWESVLNQTNLNWKAVMVLDGGADLKTKEVFSSIHHPHLVKYCFDENKGAYITREKTIELCETEWIYHIDGDDYIPADVIDIFYNSIEEKSMFFFGNTEIIDFNGHSVIKVFKPATLKTFILNNEFPRIVAFKKQFFYDFGSFEPKLNRGRGDFDFVIRLFAKNIPYTYVDKTIYTYELRRDSLCHNYDGDIGYRNFIIYLRNKDVFENSGFAVQYLMMGFESSLLYHLKKGNRILSFLYIKRIFKYHKKIKIIDKWILKMPFFLLRIIYPLKNTYRRINSSLHII